MKTKSSKSALIYTLKILQDFSDENHYLTQADIISHLEDDYSTTAERKSISANIDTLIDLGFDIIKVNNKGYYIGERVLEPTEVSYIVDALFSSKSIDGKHAKELSEKLTNLLSIYQRKKYDYIYKADDISRSNNYDLFYNIELIQEAIEKGKKLLFNYKRPYSVNNKFKNKYKYEVNPYFLMNNQGKYYLVCNFDYFNGIGNYRVDMIEDLEIEEDKAIKPITSIPGYEKGIDIAKYVQEHVYLFSDKAITATLKLDNDKIADYVVDWFGKDSKIYSEDDILYAEVTNNERSLIYWCLQYCSGVELIKPIDTREKIKLELEKANERYK